MPFTVECIKAIKNEFENRRKNFDNYNYVLEYIKQYGGQIQTKNQTKDQGST